MSLERFFDYNGSAPVHPEVLRAYTAHLSQAYGNPAAPHPQGRAARAAIEAARAVIARNIGARPQELCFTSGGSEANNQALLGTAAHVRGKHLVVAAFEHKSVLCAAQHLVDQGYECTFLPVTQGGRINVETLKAALRPDTCLVSVMLANNETGVIQPVQEIARICRERGIRYHCDAVAGLGRVRIDVNELGCDLMTLSGHKMYAPKGVGVLYVRTGVTLAPLVLGCGQQGGLRSGTENTEGIAALGRAFELLEQGLLPSQRKLERLRERLWQGIAASFPSARRNGEGPLLANTLSVYFPSLASATLLDALGERGFSVSAGATQANGQVSHVLKAMGHSDERARHTLRFSLGAFSTQAGVDALVQALRQVQVELSPCELVAS